MHQFGFDQYGVLYGQVIVDNNELELYLRGTNYNCVSACILKFEYTISLSGLRERILKKYSHKKVSLYGMSSHGFNFVINLHDYIS